MKNRNAWKISKCARNQVIIFANAADARIRIKAGYNRVVEFHERKHSSACHIYV
jgi:hypothetical protein